LRVRTPPQKGEKEVIKEKVEGRRGKKLDPNYQKWS